MSTALRAAPDILGGVLGALDLVVLQRAKDGRFVPMTDSAQWFDGLTGTPALRGEPLRLDGCSEYLDNFLIDARRYWSQPAGRLRSGAWIQVGPGATQWPLEAQALTVNGDACLLVEHLGETFAQRVELLQAARRHLLNEEALEREVQRRTAAIRQREEEIAIRLLAAAGTRDEETGSHVRRIGLFSAAIGSALGWNSARVADIRVAAPMHDIGKIGIPDAILLKPGRLTPDEYRIMQQHTVIGAKMLDGSDIALLRMSREIALGHHEKWDGSGYPHGERGEAIPIAARIVAIVDVYDAMCHRRVYKEAIPEAEVIDTMSRAAGAHFDPDLFAVFVDLLPEIRQIRDTVQE